MPPDAGNKLGCDCGRTFHDALSCGVPILANRQGKDWTQLKAESYMRKYRKAKKRIAELEAQLRSIQSP